MDLTFGEIVTLLIEETKELVTVAQKYVNDYCSGLEPVQIILYSVLITTLVIWLKNKIFDPDVAGLGYKQWILQCVRSWPIIRTKVEEKMEKVTHDVEKELQKGLEDKKFVQELPQSGWSEEVVLKEVDKYLSIGEYAWDKGFVSGAVYHGKDPVLKNLVKEVYGRTSYHNPLHPDIFPGIRIMETEIIRMTCSLFHGDQKSCGSVTTGGTESIFLACKAYRDYARYQRGIKFPNMVIPITAHAAFDKAAQMLKIKVKHIPIRKSTEVDVSAMRRAIDKNTCMLVGSTPAFPHGGIDPIEDIAKLGRSYNIPVHVDACLGGFLICFMKEAGFEVKPFDFLVEGVTSISADTHKYAYAPKGTSVILYRSKSYHHYQYSVQPDWPGGIYGTPTIGGSRSGGIIATCWASLMYHGKDFYVEATRKIINTTKYIEQQLLSIPEIQVLGEPQVSVLAVISKHFDIYRLSSALSQKGWNLNALQFPPGFHFCVTLQHTERGVADRFVSEVQECVFDIMDEPNQKAVGTAAVYGMAQQIPDRSLVSELVWAFLDACTNSQGSKKTSEEN